MSFKSATNNNQRSLLDATGDRVAHLFNTSKDDLVGSWSWRVWLGHNMQEGSARSGTEAREAVGQISVIRDGVEIKSYYFVASVS